MKLIALLDKPHSKSFTLLPVTIETDEGRLMVLGRCDSPRLLSPSMLAELYADGTAVNVSSHGIRIPGEPRPLVAGWLGSLFREKAHAADAPDFDLPDGHAVIPLRGSYWVSDEITVATQLHDWVNRTGAIAIKQRRPDLADLMQKVLPWEQITLAAVWWTRTSPEEADAYLRSASLRKTTRERIRPASLRAVCQSIVEMTVADPRGGE